MFVSYNRENLTFVGPAAEQSHIRNRAHGIDAAAALAAYATRVGVKTTVLCPDNTPTVNVEEIAMQGAGTYRVNGLINDCGRICGQVRADSLDPPQFGLSSPQFA